MVRNQSKSALFHSDPILEKQLRVSERIQYIEGIFVSDKMQSQGIGTLLLNYVKNKKSKLMLNVYQKNTCAISFYQREDFEIQGEGLDEATGEKDYLMVWKQKA